MAPAWPIEWNLHIIHKLWWPSRRYLKKLAIYSIGWICPFAFSQFSSENMNLEFPLITKFKLHYYRSPTKQWSNVFSHVCNSFCSHSGGGCDQRSIAGHVGLPSPSPYFPFPHHTRTIHDMLNLKSHHTRTPLQVCSNLFTMLSRLSARERLPFHSKPLLVLFVHTSYWRIPLSVQFLSFSCSFWENFCQIIGCATSPKSSPGKSTIHHCIVYSLGSRISPRWGAPTLQGSGGANIRFYQIFRKTAWNWKNLDWGGRPSHPLRSTTAFV